MIDFNNDGIITADDVRLTMSHIISHRQQSEFTQKLKKDSSQSLSTKDSNNSVDLDETQTFWTQSLQIAPEK